MLGHQQGKGVLVQVAGGNHRAGGVHIGEDAGHLGQLLQAVGQGAFPGHISPGHHQHIGVAFPKGVLNGLSVRAQLGGRAEDVGGAIVVAVAAGGLVRGHHQQQKHRDCGNHHPVHDAAEFLEGGHEGAVAGFLHFVAEGQRQHGGEGEHRHQTDGHALGQHQAQVGAYLEFHQAQGQKADHRGQAAGKDEHGGLAQGGHHGLALVGDGGLAVLVAVDEEHGVIQGHGQLQDGSGGVADKGNLAEDDVRAHVDENGRAQAGHDDYRLHPGGGGQRQNEAHEDHREDGDGADLGGGGGGGYHGIDRRAAHGVFIADQLADDVHRRENEFFLNGHGEQGVAVPVVGFQGVLVLHGQGRGDVRHIVQPGHGADALDGFQLPLVGQRPRDGHVPNHHPGIGNAALEFLAKGVQGQGGGAAWGQVVVHVVIDGHQRLAQHGHNQRGHEHRDNQLRMINNPVIYLAHAL